MASLRRKARKARKPATGRAKQPAPGRAGRQAAPAPAPRPSLRDACLSALSGLRLARAPRLGAGQLSPTITLDARRTSELFRLALVRAVCAPDGDPGDAAQAGEVVWTDGDAELLVRADKSRLVLTEGFALVGLPVFTEQTGEVEVVVPFATGTTKAPLGLVLATEPEPRGPAVLMPRWGDPLVAAAWQALIDLVRELAAASGVDARQEPLLPAVLGTSSKGLHLTAQARHAFDRGAS